MESAVLPAVTPDRATDFLGLNAGGESCAVTIDPLLGQTRNLMKQVSSVVTSILPRILLVAAGGALGSVARYLVVLWSGQAAGEGRFPLGTLAVNLVGCLVIGLVAGFCEQGESLSSDARLFVMTGVLGGFTTFSAFGLETVTLLRRDAFATALLYVTASVVGGLIAVWLGWKVVGRAS